MIEHIGTAVECWIWTNFLCRFLKYKPGISTRLVYGVIFVSNFAITTIFNSLMIFEGFLGIVRILMNFVLACFMLKGKIFEKLFASLIADIAVLLMNFISMNVLCRIFDVSLNVLATDRGLLRLTSIFVTKLLFLILTNVIVKTRNQEQYIFSTSEWITLSFIIIITMLVEIKIFKISLTAKMPTQDPDAIGMGIGLFAVNILVFGIMRQMSRKNQENIALLMDKMQLEVYKSQRTDSEKQQEDLKQIRHDLKNHVQYVLGLIQDQSYDKAQSYLEKMLESKLDLNYTNVNTGNKVVDIIANSKLSACSAKQIRTAVSINRFELDMEDMDICIILGNLFDNAIEACCKVEQERFIFFEIVQNKGYVILTLKNSIEMSVLKANPNLRTTKSKKKFHGVGLRSVKSVVEKYNGMMRFYEEHDMFGVKVWLPARRNIEINR